MTITTLKQATEVLEKKGLKVKPIKNSSNRQMFLVGDLLDHYSPQKILKIANMVVNQDN